jgi:hypothetical protein
MLDALERYIVKEGKSTVYSLVKLKNSNVSKPYWIFKIKNISIGRVLETKTYYRLPKDLKEFFKVK